MKQNEIYEQMSIFDGIIPNYQIKKPIRLIELFAGYGSQALALKYFGANFVHWRICEWATKSIQAYNDLHIRDYTDYSKELTQEEIINILFTYGISMNYNNPMTHDQIKRKGDKWQRKTYNNIIATHNLVNIQNARAKDLNIVDTDKYTYLLTYSFPCQDLSLSGKQKGMSKDSGTRSGLLWEVERLLTECKELPQILLMENVPQVVGQKNISDFQKWEMFLEKLGYKNYVEILNAKDYGIPQNRERCFMVSILGDYNYKMPKTMKLKYRLKDMLEKEVDEKYYLSKKMIEGMKKTNFESYKLENKLKDINGVADTIIARFDGAPQCIKVPEATKKGYAEANDGDGVYINRPQQKRGVVQKGMIQTIKTSPDVGVVVVGNYSPSGHNASSIVDSEGIAPTVMENHGTVTAVTETSNYICWKEKGKLDIECRAYFEEKYAPTLHTKSNEIKVLLNDLRIRKLTPKECFRLMGVKDDDFINVEKNQSQSSLYHLAGDSIVITCLIGLFSKLFHSGNEHIDIIRNYIEKIKE